MRSVCACMVRSWGSRSEVHAAQYMWIAAMFGLLGLLEHNRVGLFLIPPFGATLTILLVLADAAVAQPYAVVAGSVAGASVGTLLSLFGQGAAMAMAAAVVAFAAMNLMRAYHPPGVALAMYPLLLHPGRWFPLAVVLPVTIAAAGSAAVLSMVVRGWPAYPKPLRDVRGG